jgi:hypothetical protein
MNTLGHSERYVAAVRIFPVEFPITREIAGMPGTALPIGSGGWAPDILHHAPRHQ